MWGVWVDGAFHCGGGEQTRWVRNLDTNPRLTVHTESGTEVVILEGVAERLGAERTDTETATEKTLTRIDDAYEAKYDVRHGTPVFRVRPQRVLAWADFPTDATRWRFEE
ncbi:pyridoxamine 5'-phosphate oxidase-like FMN- binding protein [Haloferax elongans ATCC BAA-1513]|uniref:Pyridoxamine 5'-phosphate oxidase-like FMN-binding protein n=1 Tax=Haloferax elongans ATCC BAA-1513 TaxID=1230453 RepID=M0HN24_HALEO|nr:pyridoxamine 5'-phosphate oxidase-like FMN- binding protein [Haloferax elongans ATCC BAA-1513]